MNESSEETATLYVLDQLDASARAVFEARLLHDPGLAGLVRDLEAGLARGIRSLPPVEPPADLLARIEARLDAGAVPAAPPPSSGLRPLWLDWARWGLAASIAASLAILAFQSLRRPAAPVFVVVGLDANRNTFTEIPPQGAGARDPDARFMQLASLAENYLRKPAAPAAPASTDNRGYALFDPASQQGFIVIEQIPALAQNQRYHLWVADAATGRVRDAGALPPTDAGHGLYSFALEPSDAPKSNRPQVFITVEDAREAPEPDQPRGRVVLGNRSF